MGARDSAINAGEPKLRLSLRHDVGHDLVPHSADSPAAEPQVGMMPIAKLGRDRAPLGAIVEPPNDRLDRAPILGPGPCATNVRGRNRRLELGPLGIRQNLHRLSTPTAKQISRAVTG